MREKSPADFMSAEEIEEALEERAGQDEPPNRGAPPIGEAADSSASGAEGEGVRLEDFVAHMQTHDYIFRPAGDFWPTARVNARLPKVKLFDGSGPADNGRGHWRAKRD